MSFSPSFSTSSHRPFISLCPILQCPPPSHPSNTRVLFPYALFYTFMLLSLPPSCLQTPMLNAHPPLALFLHVFLQIRELRVKTLQLSPTASQLSRLEKSRKNATDVIVWREKSGNEWERMGTSGNQNKDDTGDGDDPDDGKDKRKKTREAMTNLVGLWNDSDRYG